MEYVQGYGEGTLPSPFPSLVTPFPPPSLPPPSPCPLPLTPPLPSPSLPFPTPLSPLPSPTPLHTPTNNTPHPQSLSIPHFGYTTSLDITALHTLLPLLNASIPACYLPEGERRGRVGAAVSGGLVDPGAILRGYEEMVRVVFLPLLARFLCASNLVCARFLCVPPALRRQRRVVAKRTATTHRADRNAKPLTNPHLQASLTEDIVDETGQYTKLTYLPILLKTLSKAMMEWPLLRSSITPPSGSLGLGGGGNPKPTLTVRPRADIALALSTPTGLYTPTLVGAEAQSVYDLASRVKRLSYLGRQVRSIGFSLLFVDTF